MHLKKIFSGTILIGLLACGPGSDPRDSAELKIPQPSAQSAQEVYLTYCKACHGADGKLRFSDAFDLSISQLESDSVKQVIRNGRKTMAGFEGIMSDEEIDLVSAYIFTLRD